MHKARLTDISIHALKPPEKGHIVAWDDIISGFGVRVSQGVWLQDVKAGHGCAFIEPHGQADRLLSLIPKRRRKDVVLFDPIDQDFSIGFNPLSNIPISRRPYVASTIVDCFKSIWGNSWGPQLEMFLYAGAAALLDFPTGTLLGLKFLMTSKKYRARVLSFVRDPAVRDFWETDFAKHMPEKEQRERTLSTLNKIGQFITDPAVRSIIGQPKSKLSFRDLMDNKKILIVSLPHGELGQMKSSLIGALVISSLHTAALTRKNPTPFFLYVDEFHNFGLGFEEMLSGIRKFGVGLILSHQYIGQLDEVSSTLAAAMKGTVGTIISFQIGGDDADTLAKTFHIKAQELSSLEPYTAYVNRGARTDLLKMEPPPEPKSEKFAQAAIKKIRNDTLLDFDSTHDYESVNE
ncbi:MAG: type IV secretory system conjugative DNA transfer family protein [Methylocella sp.]